EVGGQGEPRGVTEAVPTALVGVGEARADPRRPGVLPHDRVVHRQSGRPVPHHDRLALIGDADRRHRVRLEIGVPGDLGHDGTDVLPDLHRVVLDPPGTRQDLPMLDLGGRGGHGKAAVVEQDRPGGGGALVDGEDVGAARHSPRLRPAGRRVGHDGPGSRPGPGGSAMPTNTSRSALGPRRRSEAWRRLSEEHFDVLVVGGGVVGTGSAVDAATRGLSVALVEARDFAAGTSSRSSKMFHGGLRYLEQLDFGLVAEALHERELSMSTLAPHLVRPLKFLFPLTRRFWERPYMAAGFVLYDVMGGAKSVPPQKHYTRAGALRVAPGLREDAVIGGIRYWDTLVDDARHTLTLARTAAKHGAVVANSTQVVGYLRDGERVTGVRVRDAETGRETDVRASV